MVRPSAVHGLPQAINVQRAYMPDDPGALTALIAAQFPPDDEPSKDPEFRAVAIGMLDAVANFAENRIPDWSSTATLQHLIDQVLGPATASSGRAFAEHSKRAEKAYFNEETGVCGIESTQLASMDGDANDAIRIESKASKASSKQTHRWCVGCSLSTRVTDLLDAIHAHAWARNLSEEDLLWISPFAQAKEDAGSPTDATIIRDVLELSEGLLLVLDENATALLQEPDVLSMVPACMQLGKPLDIVARGVVLADGLTESEAHEDAHKFIGAGLRSKTEREKKFPVEVLKAGLSTELKGIDERTRMKFRSLLAAGGLMSAVQSAPDMLTRLAEALAADETRDSLRLCLASCDKVDDDITPVLSKAMRASLCSLFVDLSGLTKLSDYGVKDIAEKLPAGLRSLTLHCVRVSRLSNMSLAAVATAMPATLEVLELNFTGCRKVSEEGVEFLVSKLPPSIGTLRLALASTQIGNSGLASIASKLPPGLHELQLDFAECHGITDAGVRRLACALPAGLVMLKLSFRGCERIGNRSVAALARGLPAGLTTLSLQVKETGVSPERAKMCSDLPAMRQLAASGKPCCEVQ